MKNLQSLRLLLADKDKEIQRLKERLSLYESDNNTVIMTGEQMEEDLLKIINHYGIEKQLKYIHSEYFELDEAILECEHGYNYSPTQLGRTYENHIAEEIADIMVMLKQFQYYYGITDEEIDDVMKYKVQRQLERIDKENN